MAKYDKSRVFPAKPDKRNRVIIWDVDKAHRDGEVMLTTGMAKPVEVAITPAIQEKIDKGELVVVKGRFKPEEEDDMDKDTGDLILVTAPDGGEVTDAENPEAMDPDAEDDNAVAPVLDDEGNPVNEKSSAKSKKSDTSESNVDAGDGDSGDSKSDAKSEDAPDAIDQQVEASERAEHGDVVAPPVE